MFEASSVGFLALAFGAQEDCRDNRDGMHARAVCATSKHLPTFETIHT